MLVWLIGCLFTRVFGCLRVCLFVLVCCVVLFACLFVCLVCLFGCLLVGLFARSFKCVVLCWCVLFVLFCVVLL